MNEQNKQTNKQGDKDAENNKETKRAAVLTRNLPTKRKEKEKKSLLTDANRTA